MRNLRIGALLICLAFSGCANTEREVLTRQIEIRNLAIAASKKMLADLQTAGGPGNYHFKAYISTERINDALRSFDLLEIPVDEISTRVKLQSLRVSRYGAFPIVEIHASASRDSLNIDVEATAYLVPTSKANEFKVTLLTFTPRAHWYSFELTKSQFVRDLLNIEVAKLTEALPAIGLPVGEIISLGGPAYSTFNRFEVTDRPSYLTVRVDVPSTLWTTRPENVRYYFLNDGIFVFGELR